MKKKGFTLIELLAVIVVLAIIALIATPIVMNVIKKANMGAAERSADNYVKAVETLIATKQLDGTPLVDGKYEIDEEGILTKDGKEYEVEVSGTKPVGGSIFIDGGQVDKSKTIIDYEDYTVKYSNGKAKAEEAGAVKKLAPGLYDENDNLKISWADLTSTEYKSFAIPVWNDSVGDYEVVNLAILNIDENGNLISAYDDLDSHAYSSAYLKGKLVIDDSVKSIGYSAFQGCDGLTSVIIPDSVTSIGDRAFEWCTGLTNITMPNSLVGIDSLAFASCENLTSIIIPNSVRYIGDSAFSRCLNLKTINYKGTAAEWNTISKADFWDDETPTNKEIIYNYEG